MITLAPLFTWRSAVCDSDLPPTARHVALTLALYMNERGASAYPGATRLSADTALHEDTVRRQLNLLVSSGWLICTQRGGLKGKRRTANVYVGVIPTSWEPSTTPDRGATGPPAEDRGSEQTTPGTGSGHHSRGKNPSSTSSSDSGKGPTAPHEEENPVLSACWEAIARQRLKARRAGGGKVTSPTGWLRKVAADAQASHRTRALDLLDRFDLDAQQLVALLEDGDESVLRHATRKAKA